MRIAFLPALALITSSCGHTSITGTVGLRTAISAWCDDAIEAEIKYGDISLWDVHRVTDMSNLIWSFCETRDIFNEDISRWDLSNVVTTFRMFRGAQSFKQDLSHWNVASVETMNAMFDHATSFASDISAWNVSAVRDFRWMFYGASSFNVDISAWSLASVQSTSFMFYGATSFNIKLCWNLSAIKYTQGMFLDSGGGSVRNDCQKTCVDGDLKSMYAQSTLAS